VVLAKMPNQNKAKAFSSVPVVQAPESKYLVKLVLCSIWKGRCCLFEHTSGHDPQDKTRLYG
jgi:hypothetical protein